MKCLWDALRGGLLLTAALLLTACATPGKVAEDYAAQNEWMKAVMTYRKVCAQHPCDLEYRSRLQQIELKAADFYYQRGVRLEEAGSFDAALAEFQQGLVAMPEHNKLQQAVADVVARQQAEQLYQEGLTFKAVGKSAEARQQFEKALSAYPWHKQATDALAALKAEEEGKFSEGLALSSTAPVTLNFRQTDLKQAFEFLAKSFGVNVMFDEGTKSTPVTLFGRDVTFDQGLNLLLATTKMFYKRIGPNTILIAPDTKEKRGQYEDHVVRTFQLNVVRAKDMSEILKALLNVKKMSINEALNTISIRDTEDVVKLAEHIIENSDRKPAEIIFDVEVLEVNRTKSDKLGLDMGTYSVTAGLASPGTVPVTGSIRQAIASGTALTLPTATFRFFKQDVDAKILANPKIRVTSGKAAKIHVGDRVPLRTASIVDATGQTRTTFDYKDIGIRLSVEPVVNLDNSTSVKLTLEVSALGQNLGTPTEPAFSIGTRNAETVMLLRDGETAILGGLIRDEERNSHTKIPGVGDIPAVGSVFTSYDNSANRTDVLLTITPRVVRGWDVPAPTLREFYSGTESIYSDKPVFGTLAVSSRAGGNSPAGKAPPESGTPSSDSSDTRKETSKAPKESGSEPKERGGAPAGAADPSNPNSDDTPPTGATLSFDQSVYEVSRGQELGADVIGENLPAGSSVPLEILYNPQLLAYVGGSKGDAGAAAGDASADSARGVISVAVNPAGNTSSALAHLTLRGVKPGVSYLVFRTPSLKDANGEAVSAQVRASRIVVK